MNAPLRSHTDKLAREQQATHMPQKAMPQKAKPQIHPAILDLISCCDWSEGPTYVAPNAKTNLDEEQEIVIDPSASLLGFTEKEEERTRQKNARRAEEARAAKAARQALKPANNERAKKAPAAHMEEVYELVRLHGPLTATEAEIRMSRCGYSRSSTMRALRALVEADKVTSRALELSKRGPIALVFEVKA